MHSMPGRLSARQSPETNPNHCRNTLLVWEKWQKVYPFPKKTHPHCTPIASILEQSEFCPIIVRFRPNALWTGKRTL
jgi:hypothetical protein